MLYIHAIVTRLFSSRPASLFALALFTLSCFFGALIWPAVVNVPIDDDYDAFLDFALQFFGTTDSSHRVGLIFEQHNEHRFVLARLMALGTWSIFGSIRFDVLTHLSMILLAVALYISVSGAPIRARLAVAFPLFAFVFQPQARESLLWTSANLPGSLTFFFAAAAISFMHGNHFTSRLVAGLALVCAVYSQGNGLVLVPVFLWICVLRRGWLQTCAWGGIGALTIATYFHGYAPNPGHPGVLDGLPHVGRNVVYTMYLIGTGPGFSSAPASLVLGIFAVIIFLALCWKKYHHQNPVLFSFILFLLGSVAINALSRAEFGVTYPLSNPRYRQLSNLVVGSLLAGVVDLSLARHWQWLQYSVISAGVCFTAAAYYTFLQPLRDYSQAARTSVSVWCETGSGLMYPWPAQADRILLSSIRKGVYRLNRRDLALLRKRLHADPA